MVRKWCQGERLIFGCNFEIQYCRKLFCKPNIIECCQNVKSHHTKESFITKQGDVTMLPSSLDTVSKNKTSFLVIYKDIWQFDGYIDHRMKVSPIHAAWQLTMRTLLRLKVLNKGQSLPFFLAVAKVKLKLRHFWGKWFLVYLIDNADFEYGVAHNCC